MYETNLKSFASIVNRTDTMPESVRSQRKIDIIKIRDSKNLILANFQLKMLSSRKMAMALGYLVCERPGSSLGW